jgi:hypothetical protein
MGFKINKSIIQGTDAHRGVLESASALKSKSYSDAKKANPNLDKLIRARKTVDKGSDAYNKIQNQINKAYGVKKRHGRPRTNTPGGGGVKPKNTIPKGRVVTGDFKDKNNNGIDDRSETNKKGINTKGRPTKGSAEGQAPSFKGKNRLENLSGDLGITYLGGQAIKSKTGQKVIKKGLGKAAAKGGAKLASRFIPGIGWGLAAYDIAKTGYYSAKKGSLKEGLKDLGRDYGLDKLFGY